MSIELVSKKAIRKFINEVLNEHIYSTANLKSTGEYRLSICAMGNYRYCCLSDISQGDMIRIEHETNLLKVALVLKWPQLAGHINHRYHIRLGVYLSLRISNALLKR
jgi:hypothetical protein